MCNLDLAHGGTVTRPSLVHLSTANKNTRSGTSMAV